MSRKLPQRDPIAAHQRKVTAARRVGNNAKCTGCGEDRPEALIKSSKPRVCHECSRKRQGKTDRDRHHIAGAANSPITVSIRANDHQARLSFDQYDWPQRTLENPDGSPLLTLAARTRGFGDFVPYLIEQLLDAEKLEDLDAVLTELHGSRWWLKPEFKRVAPEGKSNDKR
jgi:hypothetical protein